MKKIIFLAILAFAVYTGYNFYNSPTGQDAVDTAKITKLGYEVVNEKDPAIVLETVKANEELVQKMIEQEVITEENYSQFTGLMTELVTNGQEVDKKQLAEVYLKDKVTPDNFEEVITILNQDTLGLSDMNEIRALLK